MDNKTKPAATGADGGHREIKIADWRPHSKGSLAGFFTASMPSGIVFHDLMLHKRDGSRWISFPARGYKDAQGERQFARWIDFATKADRDRFQSGVLAVLDRFINSGQESEEEQLL